MLGRTRRIHFVGIGGIGMSGIAELLANLGYEVSGSDAKRSDVTERLADARRPGRRRARRRARRRRRRRRRVVGGAAGRTRRSSRRGARRIPVIPRAEMLAELMRLRYGDRGRRRARQDDDDVDDRAGARARRARSDGGDRRPAERLRQQRAARARRLHGGRGGRKRPIVPEAVSDDCGDHEHRPRAPGELRQLRRPAAGVRRLRQQGAVLRRGRRVRRRRAGARRCCRG